MDPSFHSTITSHPLVVILFLYNPLSYLIFILILKSQSCTSDGPISPQVTETDDPLHQPVHPHFRDWINNILIIRSICEIYLIITCVKEGVSVQATDFYPIKSPWVLNHGSTTLVIGVEIKERFHVEILIYNIILIIGLPFDNPVIMIFICRRKTASIFNT